MARRRDRLVTGRTMFNVEGLEEVRNLLDILKKETPQVYQEELERAGDYIKSSAKSKIHSVTGALSGSVKKESKFTQTRQFVSVMAGGVQAPHAHLVEFGHRQITKKGEIVGDVPAHPFLRSAFMEYRDILVEKLTQAIDRLAR